MTDVAIQSRAFEKISQHARSRALSRLRFNDGLFFQLTRASAIIVLILLAGIILSLVFGGALALGTFGFNFLISERWRLQLRVEYFNMFNHPNFAPESISTGTVNSTDQISSFDKISSNSFGTFRAGQVGDPRIAQLAVKVSF